MWTYIFKIIHSAVRSCDTCILVDGYQDSRICFALEARLGLGALVHIFLLCVCLGVKSPVI